jgi:general secretion pathway protein H
VKGFTLIELLVVLLIAAGAIALVLPQLSSARAGSVLKSDARKLASALRAARAQAIARQHDVAYGAIRFFPDGSSSGGTMQLGKYIIEVDWLTGRVAILD